VLSQAASYVSGDPEGDGLRVRYYHHPDESSILARAWFGPRTAGPPGHAHGGSISAVLDESMGVATLFSGRMAVARQLTIDFLQMLTLGMVATVFARIDRVENAKVFASATLLNGEGNTCATSEGVFINIGLDRMVQMIDHG
jgi:acyl-coenzyme A thioesterase PaaI-like protein